MAWIRLLFSFHSGLGRIPMSALLFAAMLTVGVGQDAQPTASAAPNVNGKWMVVYAEQKGHRIESWNQQRATLQDGALSYQTNGKEETLHLKFGPHQTVTATGGNGKMHTGVFIASKEYLCISLRGTARSADQGASEEQEAKGAGPAPGHSSGSFILILRRNHTREAGK